MIIYKHDHLGRELLHYEGILLARDDSWVCVEARFGADYADVEAFEIRKGDLMTEWFYSDRYYNVFKVQDGRTGQLKGWYCNITRPAHITDTEIHADDLALDVIVSPEREILVLDRDEFAELQLDPREQALALEAVEAIRRRVERIESPFS